MSNIPTILIIDDSPVIRRTLLSHFPSELQSRILEEMDGLEGLRAFHRARPRLVLLDISMPRMTGIEFLEAIQPHDHQARIVVLTSESDPEVIGQAKALGAHDVLFKPWSRQDILRVLREAGLIQRASSCM